MNIHKLFSTEERVRILRHTIYKTSYLNVNKIASELNLSKGLISKFFNILCKENILKRSNNKFTIEDNMNTRALKILLNFWSLDLGIFKKYKFIKSVGVYGSLTKGKNTEESDIDMWILTDNVKEEHLAKLTSELKNKYENVKPLYLTKSKLDLLKKDDPIFYYSLFFSSITIYGDELETF